MIKTAHRSRLTPQRPFNTIGVELGHVYNAGERSFDTNAEVVGIRGGLAESDILPEIGTPSFSTCRAMPSDK